MENVTRVGTIVLLCDQCLEPATDACDACGNDLCGSCKCCDAWDEVLVDDVDEDDDWAVSRVEAMVDHGGG